MKILDYSFSRPNLPAVRSAGYAGVMRYLSWLPNRKVITEPERDSILAQGLLLGLNWEFDEFDVLNSSGVEHATEAVRQARALGYPQGCAIYYSGGDFNLQPQHIPALVRYLTNARRIHAGRYRLGLYGGRYPVETAFNEGLIDVGWQACVPYAWYRNGPQYPENKSPKASAWQYHNGATVGGSEVDISEVNTKLPLYIWGSDDMPLTTEDITAIAHGLATNVEFLRAVARYTWDVDYVPSGRPDNSTWQAKTALSTTMLAAEKAAAQPPVTIDANAIANAVVAKLPPNTPQDLEAVKNAVKQALREGTA